MGNRAYAIILYGITTEAPEPWAKYDDIDDWWMDITGFAPSVAPFTPDGQYAPGFDANSPEVDQLSADQSAWKKSHPMPVSIIHTWAKPVLTHIAVRGTVIRADWDEPQPIGKPNLGNMVSFNETAHFIAWMRDYLPDVEPDPTWLLVADYG